MSGVSRVEDDLEVAIVASVEALVRYRRVRQRQALRDDAARLRVASDDQIA